MNKPWAQLHIGVTLSVVGSLVYRYKGLYNSEPAIKKIKNNNMRRTKWIAICILNMKSNFCMLNIKDILPQKENFLKYF